MKAYRTKETKHLNLHEAEHQISDAIAQTHPEWKDQYGECASCTSLAHDLADPSYVLTSTTMAPE